MEQQTLRDKLFIYGLYIKLIDGIKHFDTVQTYYRTLASSILLASFAAIGFLLTSKGGILTFWPGRGTVLVSVLSLLAINFIKVLDIKYQEEFLICNFLALLKLEKENDWLPKAHRMMIYQGKHLASTYTKDLFYIGCSMILFILITLSWIHSTGYDHPFKIALIILFFVSLSAAYIKGSLALIQKINDMIQANLEAK